MAKAIMTIETISTNPDHFDTHHENDETIVCMQHAGTCSVLVEVDGTPEQQAVLERASEKALQKLDAVFGGRFAEAFSGLHIKFGQYEDGGEAHQEKNEITFDIEKMSMSLADAENHLVEQGVLNPGDWTRTMSEEEAAEPGSCLTYNLVHEVYHLIDERAEDGSWTGIDTSQSPTKYGTTKRNEAGAEAFTYMVFGQPIDPMAQSVVQGRIETKVTTISSNNLL